MKERTGPITAEVVEVVQVESPDGSPGVALVKDVVRLAVHGGDVVVPDPLLLPRAEGVRPLLATSSSPSPAVLHWETSLEILSFFYTNVLKNNYYCTKVHKTRLEILLLGIEVSFNCF